MQVKIKIYVIADDAPDAKTLGVIEFETAQELRQNVERRVEEFMEAVYEADTEPLQPPPAED